MNLYVDIGNSRCKLRSGSTGPVTVLASTEGEITAGIAMIASRGGAPLRILVSSVAGPGPADELVRACLQHWKLE
ncbi:MAG: hypothetical protein EBV86_10635, partial [Marivivens sp.]|nr:hypothetical protein [Marivivens sp.]